MVRGWVFEYNEKEYDKNFSWICYTDMLYDFMPA